jgi:hypothetical protein
MISSTSVESAIADAAAALDFDYGDPTALTVDRVEEFRDLVRVIRQAMRTDLGISDA